MQTATTPACRPGERPPSSPPAEVEPPGAGLARFRGWLRAAAAYTLLWGTLVVLFPSALHDLIGAPSPADEPLWQAIGMFVLVYAPAYWWASRDPVRHRHLVLIGLAG